MKIQIEDIISDIQDESCVLIIGPDIIDFDGKTLFEKLCSDLNSDANMKDVVDIQPQHIFMQDEMFQLQPNARESSLKRFLGEFYKKQTVLDEPLSKIAKIKFHVILSLLPDKRLPEIFDKLNLPYQFGFYTKEEVPAPVEKPHINKPLIYNLLGNFEEEEYVITFDHLFTYLSGIMGKRELPQTLLETIKKARSFMFLGVQFERWYVQMMLRIITDSKERQDKLSLLKSPDSSELRGFVTRRLDLNFMEDEPMDFLQVLYDKCNEKGVLKIPEAKSIAKVFISYNHKDAAVVDQMKKHFDENSIAYLLDERDMPGGEKIADFVDKVKNVDCVVSIVSENSLMSAWVSQETHLTLLNPNILFLPCYIDEAFMDGQITVRAEKHVDDKIAEINAQIMQRGKNPTDDLQVERKQWETYWQNFTSNLNNITQRKCINLLPENFESNMSEVISAIAKNAKRASQ